MQTPELNPQPEPPSPELIIVTAITKQEQMDIIGVYSHAGMLEVNLKTHRVTLKHPEMGVPGGLRAAKALAGAITTWHDANNVAHLEQLRTPAEQLLVASVKAVLEATARK